jgi:hypothetical protein
MGEFVGSVIIIGVLILAFFIFRGLVLWYWKLDKIEEHLAAIRESLEKE